LRTSDLLHSPRAQIIDAREASGTEEQDDQGENCERRDQLGAFCFTQKDLEKAQADGLIFDDDQVIFLSTKRIPKAKSGFQVMFFAFLLRGLSLPAHEFLRGLFFVYDVQLYQLTQNSILYIACFITLCESFLGIDPHFLLWRSDTSPTYP
jgi:hypothetical protein